MFDHFYCGLVYGVFAGGIIGYILDRIHESRSKMGQQYRTFDSYTDAERPHLTSIKVVRSSLWGTLGCGFWVIMLIVLFVALAKLALYIQNFGK